MTRAAPATRTAQARSRHPSCRPHRPGGLQGSPWYPIPSAVRVSAADSEESHRPAPPPYSAQRALFGAQPRHPATSRELRRGSRVGVRSWPTRLGGGTLSAGRSPRPVSSGAARFAARHPRGSATIELGREARARRLAHCILFLALASNLGSAPHPCSLPTAPPPACRCLLCFLKQRRRRQWVASPRRGAAALWPLFGWGQVPQGPSLLPTAGCPGIIPLAVVAAPLHTHWGHY